MRRKYFTSTLFFALPTADALSLANFQQITSILIPLTCQLTYDSQIPTCTKSDFNNGCSAGCIAALNTVAQNVADSCASTTVNSNTLLGIVKNGGIVAALCPTLSTTTSTLLRSSTTPVAVSAAPAVSVTIPTDSVGVTGGLGFKTTSATITSIPAPQSIVSISTSSVVHSSSVVSVTIKSTSTKTTSTSTSTSTSSSSTTSLESAGGGIGGGSAVSTTTTTSTSSSKKGSVATSSATAKPAAAPDDGGTGGGSPFDISSGASRIENDSMLGMVILVMACILMR